MKMVEVQTDSLTLETASREETQALGEALGQLLRPGDVVALVGPLGAGKTTLAQGIARGLGITVPLTSPTFILINEYPLSDGGTLYHADAYRFDRPQAEARAMGLDEIFDERGIALVEWAERVADLLPDEHLRIELLLLPGDRRRFRLVAQGERACQLLADLRTASP